MVDNTNDLEKDTGSYAENYSARIDVALLANDPQLLTPEEIQRIDQGVITLIGGGPNLEAAKYRRVFPHAQIINVDKDESVAPLAQLAKAKYNIDTIVASYQQVKIPTDLAIMLSPSVSSINQIPEWTEVTKAALTNLKPDGVMLIFTQHLHEEQNMRNILTEVGGNDWIVKKERIAPLRGIKNESLALSVRKKKD